MPLLGVNKKTWMCEQYLALPNSKNQPLIYSTHIWRHLPKTEYDVQEPIAAVPIHAIYWSYRRSLPTFQTRHIAVLFRPPFSHNQWAECSENQRALSQPAWMNWSRLTLCKTVSNNGILSLWALIVCEKKTYVLSWISSSIGTFLTLMISDASLMSSWAIAPAAMYSWKRKCYVMQ